MSRLKVDRTTAGLRTMLFQEIELLRNNTTTPARLRAIVGATSQILASAKLDLEVASMPECERPSIDAAQTLRLSHDDEANAKNDVE